MLFFPHKIGGFMKKSYSGKILFPFFLFVLASGAAFSQSAWFMSQTEKAPVESVLATSELVEAQFSGKYLYPPINVLDGDFSTVWCEAQKDGPGIGESITIEFSEAVSFDEIQIVNGFAHKDYYAKNNRVKTLTLTQTAGKHFQQKDYTLLDEKPDWQSIPFALTQTAQTLTFKIASVYKGAKYDDTCIGDIRLLYKGKVLPFENVETLKAVQEENSKLMLKNSEKDFKKEFYALFGGEYYLYLRNEKGGGFLVYEDPRLGFYMEDCVFVKAMSKNDIFNKYFKYGIPPNIEMRLKDYKHENYDYIIPRISRRSYWDETRFKLSNYRILKYETIQYVETVTAMLVKLDGKTVYLNGVKYTVLNSKRVIDVTYNEG